MRENKIVRPFSFLMKNRALQYFLFPALLAITVILFSGNAFAANIGDSAFPLQIEKWVKGESINLSREKGKKIFIVEFWATWCGPCRVTAPFLTKLQKKYKDKGVVIIGISDEKQKTVENYLKKKDAGMEYTVAVDKDRKTTKAYFDAFGLKGIPHAFIIKSGRIAWHGHPMKGMEETIKKIIAGSFDLGKEVHAAKAKELFPVYFYLAGKTNEADLIKMTGERLFEYSRNNKELLDGLAWGIATEKDLKVRDFNLAYKAVKRANELASGKNSFILDTYARILYLMGQKEEAIRYQKKAISLTEDKALIKELNKNLKEYQGKK